MTTTETSRKARKMARELTPVLDGLTRSLTVQDPPPPRGVEGLTLLDMRILLALQDAHWPLSISEVANRCQLSPRQAGQAAGHLAGRGLVTRSGGGGGATGMVTLGPSARQLLMELEAARLGALESFISQLGPSERLRLEGALHLLGNGLDRAGRGMLAA